MSQPWLNPRDDDPEAYEIMPWNEPAACLTCGALLSEDSDLCNICGSAVSARQIVLGSALPDSLRLWAEAGVLRPMMAGFWRRCLALLVDSMVVGVLIGLIVPMVGVLSTRLGGLLLLGIPALYYIIPYSTTGQTIGKRWLGMRVVAIDGTGLTWRKGINRCFGYLPSSAPLLLGYLWAIWDKDKQAWHDKLASTMVVRTNYPFFPPIDPSTAQARERRWVMGMVLGFGGLIFGATTLGGIEAIFFSP